MYSMISEQVKELREYSGNNCDYGVRLAKKAAETIESLSAKLQAENMENGSGWIDFNDKLPSDEQKVLVSKDRKTLNDLFEFYFPDKDCEDSEVLGFLEGESASYDGFVILKGNNDGIKWQPLPEPYRP